MRARRIVEIILSCVWLIALCGKLLAQCPACPTMIQLASTPGPGIDQGIASNATPTIVISANGDGTGSIDADDATAMENAANQWSGMKGSNGDVSIETYGSPVDVSALLSAGTETNPVFIVERVSNATAASLCDGSDACAPSVQDSNNVTTGGIIFIADAVFNGTVATDFPYNNPVDLGTYFSHEFGVHDVMGWMNASDDEKGTAAAFQMGPPTLCDQENAASERGGDCTISCSESDDCPDGAVCSGGVCEASCSNDGQCPMEASCVSGGCAAACIQDSQCPPGLVCSDNVCKCSNTCEDSTCPGYDDLACNCPTNECYSESCSDYDYCTCNPDDPSCQAGSCDPNDDDECDPNSCFYDYWQCFVDCGCEDLCGYLEPVMGLPSDLSVPVDADPNLLVPHRPPSPSFKPHPMCEVLPIPNAPQTATPATYVAAVQAQESSVEWRIG